MRCARITLQQCGESEWEWVVYDGSEEIGIGWSATKEQAKADAAKRLSGWRRACGLVTP